MKTKLLIVTDYFYPHWTGYAKWVYYVVASLEGKSDVTVLTVQHESGLRKEERMFSARIIREPFLFTISRSKYSLAMIMRFLSIVNNNNVILINSPCANILPLAIITKLVGKKLLIFHQGDLILPKGFINRVMQTSFDISSYISFAIADKVSTYTKDYAKHSRVLKPFLSKCYSLLPPIFIPPQKSFKKDRKILFGFAGRFVEEKGFDILLAAIPKVLDKLPQAHFVFAGETNISYENFFEKVNSLLQKVEQHITLLGLLSKERLIHFYETISFIVIPSRSDCFNLVQAEAMIAGTPSIVSNIPGARYLVKETGFGMLFEKENADDLAEKLILAVANRKNIVNKYKNVLSVLEKKICEKELKEFIEN